MPVKRTYPKAIDGMNEKEGGGGEETISEMWQRKTTRSLSAKRKVNPQP